LGDLREEQGYSVAVLAHSKGDKRRKIKIPQDVKLLIENYLVACERDKLPPTAPLFVRFRRGDHPQSEAISGQVIERLVSFYAKEADLTKPLTPHGLRATFVTLALEGGAKLEQVQYAVGHADPRTTERYQKRKFKLTDNAVDYIHLDLA
jgi:integrase/recombinase XerD